MEPISIDRRVVQIQGWNIVLSKIREQIDYNYHSVYSRERTLFQDVIVDSMLEENTSSTREARNCPQPHWIVFTAGAMGAGKSHTIKLLHQKGRFPLQLFTVVDPDRIRRLLPEFETYVKLNPENAGELTRKEAGLIAEILVEAALERGSNVLVDGSLRDAVWYQQYFQQLRLDHPNLRIAILHITAPRESVFQHAAVRP
jgi:Zeta toxin